MGGPLGGPHESFRAEEPEEVALGRAGGLPLCSSKRERAKTRGLLRVGECVPEKRGKSLRSFCGEWGDPAFVYSVSLGLV